MEVCVGLVGIKYLVISHLHVFAEMCRTGPIFAERHTCISLSLAVHGSSILSRSSTNLINEVVVYYSFHSFSRLSN